MKNRLILVIILVVLLAGAGGAWWFWQARMAAPSPSVNTDSGETETTSGESLLGTQSPGPVFSQNAAPEPIEQGLEAHQNPAVIPYYLPTGQGDGVSAHTVADYLVQRNAASEPPADNSVVSIPDQTAGTGGSAVAAPNGDGSADPDGDGLTNDQERQLNTNPNNRDTDGDGRTDGDEARTLRTDPRRADTDGDGLTDGEETTRWKTDPLNPDTDADGYPDGAEAKGGYNPNGPGKL